MRRFLSTIVLLFAFLCVVAERGAAAPQARSAKAQQTQLARRVVGYARRQLGMPYRWGGTSSSGFDCSGLVFGAYRSIGRTIPRSTWGQLQTGRRVSWQNLRPGDLVFTNGGRHVVLVVSPSIAISAPRAGRRVHFVPLGSLRPVFYAARRLLV